MSVEQIIIEKLTHYFHPQALHIENESHRHSSGKGAESHFKVVLVSSQFEGKRAVARHREVYTCLTHELETGVHALALHLFTPDEWEAEGNIIPESTNCRGHAH